MPRPQKPPARSPGSPRTRKVGLPYAGDPPQGQKPVLVDSARYEASVLRTALVREGASPYLAEVIAALREHAEWAENRIGALERAR
jgi:hypothetical protein